VSENEQVIDPSTLQEFEPTPDEKTRSAAYYVGLWVSVATFIAGGVALIWLEGELSAQVTQTAVLVGGAFGIVSSGFGVKYRPTKYKYTP
jgi:hypothetical protein